MRDFKLYLILDIDLCSDKAIKICREAVKAGVDLVQIRAKDSSVLRTLEIIRKLRPLFLKYKIPFIVNDRLDLAKLVRASGVHLGQTDLPIKFARKILGKNKMIGISCHNIQQAIKAQVQGADYLSVGPIFKTSTKPEYKPVGVSLIKLVKNKIKIPFVAIGGIKQANIKEVLSAGAKRVAICQAICQATDVFKTVKYFKAILNKI